MDRVDGEGGMGGRGSGEEAGSAGEDSGGASGVDNGAGGEAGGGLDSGPSSTAKRKKRDDGCGCSTPGRDPKRSSGLPIGAIVLMTFAVRRRRIGTSRVS